MLIDGIMWYFDFGNMKNAGMRHVLSFQAPQTPYSDKEHGIFCYNTFQIHK